MPNTVPAAAEGLPAINRRSALSVAGSSIVAALAGVAASTMPAPALPLAEPENVHVKVRRLSRELAMALDDWQADMGGEQWVAHVYAFSSRAYPVAFENVTAMTSAREAAAIAAADAVYRTPAMQIFRKWARLYRRAGKPGLSSDQVDRLVDRASRYEKRLMAMPTNSAIEYAAKVLVVTGNGDYGFGDYEARLIADAKQLVGEA
jgi:hypothetical protein